MLINCIQNEDDYIAILAAGQGTNEEECWACHRRCFAWSITLGALILVTGITCLMVNMPMCVINLYKQQC